MKPRLRLVTSEPIIFGGYDVRDFHLGLKADYDKILVSWIKGFGAAWRPGDKEWMLPASPGVCRAMRYRFGADLAVDANVALWYAQAERHLRGMNPEDVSWGYAPDDVERAWLYGSNEARALAAADINSPRSWPDLPAGR